MKLPVYKKMFSAAGAASVLLITAACGTDDAANAKTDTASSTSSTADISSSSSSSYTDGEYEAEGSYSTPGGTSKVTVDLTLEGDTITAVTVTPPSTGTTPTSSLTSRCCSTLAQPARASSSTSSPEC